MWHGGRHSYRGGMGLPCSLTCPGGAFFSDESGSWDCGAYNSQNLEWFQLQWPASWSEVNIAVKEFVSVLVSAALWGYNWAGTEVLFRSDNQSVMNCLASRSSRDQHPISPTEVSVL